MQIPGLLGEEKEGGGGERAAAGAVQGAPGAEVADGWSGRNRSRAVLAPAASPGSVSLHTGGSSERRLLCRRRLPGSGSPSPLPCSRPAPRPTGRSGSVAFLGDGWPLSMAQYGHPSPLGMAAREELYSKVTPRRNRQQRPGTIKHGSALDVLLSMGFPRARA